MITLSAYATAEEVRQALGITDLEFPDASLTTASYTRALQRALSSITGSFVGSTTTTGTLIDIFEALSDIVSPTADEELMLFLIKDFAVLTLAVEILPTLSMIATRRLSDGKASVERFTTGEVDSQSVSERVRAKYNSIISNIQAALGTAATAAIPILIVRAEPDDVVTTA